VPLRCMILERLQTNELSNGASFGASKCSESFDLLEVRTRAVDLRYAARGKYCAGEHIRSSELEPWFQRRIYARRPSFITGVPDAENECFQRFAEGSIMRTGALNLPKLRLH
jgi:hypothetical protein